MSFLLVVLLLLVHGGRVTSLIGRPRLLIVILRQIVAGVGIGVQALQLPVHLTADSRTVATGTNRPVLLHFRVLADSCTSSSRRARRRLAFVAAS